MKMQRVASVRRVSVIVPTCNRNHLLARALEALSPAVQDVSPDAYEVIICDDSESSSARETAEAYSPWAHWVKGPQRGPAANRNKGACEANAEWLLFTDDDCVPSSGWVRAYLDAVATHEGCSVFEGRTHADRPRRSLDETAPINQRGGCLWSCNFAIRKSLFQRLNGFNECFPYPAMEDVEFAHRLRDEKQEIIFVEAAAVCHPWRRLGGWKELRRHHEATLFYLKLHPEERRRINSGYYVKSAARSLLCEVLPAVVSMRLKGLGGALIHHGGSLLMALRLARIGGRA